MESMDFAGMVMGFFGAMLSCDGLCEKPIILVINKMKIKASFLFMHPNLAVKVIKSWERKGIRGRKEWKKGRRGQKTDKPASRC